MTKYVISIKNWIFVHSKSRTFRIWLKHVSRSRLFETEAFWTLTLNVPIQDSRRLRVEQLQRRRCWYFRNVRLFEALQIYIIFDSGLFAILFVFLGRCRVYYKPFLDKMDREDSRDDDSSVSNRPSVEKPRRKVSSIDHFLAINERPVDDISLKFFYKPHTLTLLTCAVLLIVYTAFTRFVNVKLFRRN